VVMYLERGANDLRMVQLMPLPLSWLSGQVLLTPVSIDEFRDLCLSPGNEISRELTSLHHIGRKVPVRFGVYSI